MVTNGCQPRDLIAMVFSLTLRSKIVSYIRKTSSPRTDP